MKVVKSLLIASLALAGLVGLASCGEVRNPFAKEEPFVATAVPPDFAIVVEETQDTYYSREDIRQVLSSTDMMSRTTYRTYRDFNNGIGDKFTLEYPVSATQLQNMWNEVQRYKLMEGASTWYYWQTNPDNYRRNERAMQIRANGQMIVYRQLNHWGYKLRDLALQVEAVRLPMMQSGPGTSHIEAKPSSLPPIVPPTQPSAPPATAPATQPAAAAAPSRIIIQHEEEYRTFGTNFDTVPAKP